MEFLAHLPVRAFWVLAAAGCAVAGAPLFAAGLRALRLRRALARLAECTLEAATEGLLRVRGRVALEGPLFAPLSGRPCAGYTLEIVGAGMRVGGMVHELRPFRVVQGGASARVVPDHARWRGAVTFERTLAAAEQLPARLAELLDSSAEVRWLRDRRATLRLVERAIEAGTEVHVTGIARGVATVATVETVELAATGTDGAFYEFAPSPHGRPTRPELWIEAGEPLNAVLVSDAPPSPDALAPGPGRLALLVLGPLLTLGGLFYLAQAVAPLLAGRLTP